MKAVIVLLVLTSIILNVAYFQKALSEAEENAEIDNTVDKSYIIPDSSCSLSPGERDVIEKAWFTKSGYRFKWCSEDFPDGMRCYGRCGNAIILFKPKTVVAKTMTVIADEIIISEKGFDIYAFINGEIVVFSKYNKENPISESEAKEISKIHDLYENEVKNARKIHNIIAENAITPPALQDGIKDEMNDAYMKNYGVRIFDDSESLNNDARYYGNYNGYEIIFLPSPLCAVTEIEIAGCHFSYSSVFNIFAYKDGSFHKLENAYESEWLSEEDILEIARVHYFKK